MADPGTNRRFAARVARGLATDHISLGPRCQARLPSGRTCTQSVVAPQSAYRCGGEPSGRCYSCSKRMAGLTSRRQVTRPTPASVAGHGRPTPTAGTWSGRQHRTATPWPGVVRAR